MDWRDYSGDALNRVRYHLGDDEPDELAVLYALLALVKGNRTSLEDVHDAWALWTTHYRRRRGHPNNVPFDALDQETAEYDRKYRDAIRAASEEMGLR